MSIHQDIKMLDAVKNYLKKKSIPKGYPKQFSVSGKLAVEELKGVDTKMDDANIPNIKRNKVDKLLDEFDGTHKEMKHVAMTQMFHWITITLMLKEKSTKMLKNSSNERKLNCSEWNILMTLKNLSGPNAVLKSLHENRKFI